MNKHEKYNFIVNTLLYPIYHWMFLKTVVWKNISCHLWKHSLISISVKAWETILLFKMKIKQFIHHLTIQIYCLICYKKKILFLWRRCSAHRSALDNGNIVQIFYKTNNQIWKKVFIKLVDLPSILQGLILLSFFFWQI